MAVGRRVEYNSVFSTCLHDMSLDLSENGLPETMF